MAQETRQVFDGNGTLIAVEEINTPSDSILSQIRTIEATITPRRIREAILGTDAGWLSAHEAEISTLRAQII